MERSDILSMPLQKLIKPRIRGAYLYLTERCTLNCGYCFFRHKKGRNLPRTVILRFLSLLDSQLSPPRSFVISGGEPLLVWDNLCFVVKNIKQRHPLKPIHLQTNGMLLSAERVDYLKRNEISVEFGIDGNETITRYRRKGLNHAGWLKLVGNIKHCLERGVRCGCTMTVHPDEAGDILERVRFLHALGLRSIDVTPAAFMPWTQATVAAFCRGYTKVIADSLLRRVLLVCEDKEIVSADDMDLSLHPPGHLLAGDAFLCLPEKQRRAYNLWDRRTGCLNGQRLLFYQNMYELFHRRQAQVTYRDLVCCNFEIVNDIMGFKYINTDPMVYLMNFLTKIHQLMFRKSMR